MKKTSMPALVAVPFAEEGAKNIIPVDSQIGITDGAASYTDGFPPLTMTPVIAGGIPPAGGDFNGILNAITQSVRWACAGGQYQYDSTFSATVGGYPKGALIQSAGGDVVWLNLNDDNVTNPDSGSGWVPAIRYGVTSIAMAGANVTLTSAQAAKETIIISGTLTANVQLIMPAWAETWMIINNTTGAFTVAVKTASGSGVNLAAGTTSQIYGDGTNIYYESLMVRNNLGEIKAAGTNSQAAARLNLALGTAATADAQTSKDDVTVGRLLVNGGALALRTVLAGAGRAITDFDGLPANSISFGYSDATHSPGFTGSVLDFSGSSGRYNAQIATQYNASGNRIAFRTHNGDAAGAWNNWFEFYHTGNKPTAADIGAMPYFGTAMSMDLNTLGAYSAAGVHYQPTNAGATTANHYPVAEAGALLVLPSAYGCQQEYTTFGTGRKFLRGLSGAWNGTNGPWGNWNELYGPTNPNEIVSTSANSFRIAYGGYGAFWRQDGGHLYLMLTNHDDPHGSYNALRPFNIDLATGNSIMGRLALTDYANFDARYNHLNTAALAAGGGWWQDGSTGLIMQMGIVNRTAPGTTVAFPKAFPNYCMGVLLTLNMYIGSLKDSDANIRVLSHSNTNFSYGAAGDPEKTSFWVAFGK